MGPPVGGLGVSYHDAWTDSLARGALVLCHFVGDWGQFV